MALDSDSGDALQPGAWALRFTHFAPWCGFFHFSVVMSSADTIIIESAQITVYLTTDVPRTRAYSVNPTYTPNVRFPGTVCSRFADKYVRRQIS